jgi:hypothetical protein
VQRAVDGKTKEFEQVQRALAYRRHAISFP